MEMFSVCAARVLEWVSLINEGNGSVQFAIGPRGFGHLAVIFQLTFVSSLPGEAVCTIAWISCFPPILVFK